MILKNIGTTGLSLSDISAQDNFLDVNEQRVYIETDEFVNSKENGAISKFLANGSLSIIEEPLNLADGIDATDIASWVRSGDTQAVFAEPTVTVPLATLNGAGKNEQCLIENASGIVDIFRSGSTVSILATASARTVSLSYLKADGTYSTPVVGLTAAANLVPVINGAATVKVKGGTLQAADTVTLTITATSQVGLTATSTCVITVS